jgi:hypothetical protein
MRNCTYTITGLCIALALLSCSSGKKFTESYYKENETILLSMKHRFKQQYDEHPFSLEIKDKKFKQVGLEIITDSIRYIYNFPVDDLSLTDTLQKYKFNAVLVTAIIHDMQKTHCTWLTNLDYYEKLEKKYLVFASVRHRKLESVFRKDKYFTLAFFDFPQPFDKKGRLLDRRDRKQLRRINGAALYRMNDKVAYALTAHFR